MKTLTPQRKRLAGFSLVELAIVLLITTILMSAGLSLLTLKREASQREATQKKQEAIKQALINYLGQNKRLPCPADFASVGKEVRNVAPTPPTQPPCNSYSGIVPYSELGMDRSAALDGWENYITYVVSPNIITPAPPTYTQPNPPSPPAQLLAPAPLLTTAWLYTYNNSTTTTSSTPPYTNTNNLNPPNPWVNPLTLPPSPFPSIPLDAAFWSSTSTGGIIVAQTFGGSANPIPPLIADPALATGAVVALISHGKNGYGAFNVKGVQNDYASAGDDEKRNADPAKLVTFTNPPKAAVVKRDTTDSPTLVVAGVTLNSGAFDDIVMMLSANDLTGPLIANGTLQSNAQAALNQANDIVIGSIVSSKIAFSAAVPQAPPMPFPATNSGLLPLSNCVAGSYYYTIKQNPLTPPTFFFIPTPNVSAWGVSYMQDASYFSVLLTLKTSDIYLCGNDVFPVGTTMAYTLTAGDGTQKIVTIKELQGILTRGASFN